MAAVTGLEHEVGSGRSKQDGTMRSDPAGGSCDQLHMWNQEHPAGQLEVDVPHRSSRQLRSH